MAFVGETRVLGMNADDELDESDISGFDAASQVSKKSCLFIVSVMIFVC